MSLFFVMALAEAPKPYSGPFLCRDDLSDSRKPLSGVACATRPSRRPIPSIERNVGTNINQLLVLANFYISIENGNEAKRYCGRGNKAQRLGLGSLSCLGPREAG